MLIVQQLQRTNTTETATHSLGGQTVLSLLYPTACKLIDNADVDAWAPGLLQTLTTFFNGKHGVLLSRDTGGRWFILASSDNVVGAFYLQQINARKSDLEEGLSAANPDAEIIFITNNDQPSGIVIIDQPTLDTDAHPLFVASLKQSLGQLIMQAGNAQRQRQQVVYQERAIIAGELHDSLAQSLSYLKIQATRLQKQFSQMAVHPNTDQQEIDETLEELRTNLSLAYRQLRELMTTFRLTMNGKTLADAVADSIDEFKQRTNIAFATDIRVNHIKFSAQEELQVLQITREALSNIVRHSHASNASVLLTARGETVLLEITDNGIGIEDDNEHYQHHGLIIMQERAQRLHGELSVKKLLAGGTLISVTFVPQHYAHNDQTGG